jgi:hypothetical protein
LNNAGHLALAKMSKGEKVSVNGIVISPLDPNAAWVWKFGMVSQIQVNGNMRMGRQLVAKCRRTIFAQNIGRAANQNSVEYFGGCD